MASLYIALAAAEKVVGVDIGEDAVAAAALSVRADGRLQLLAAGSEELPAGGQDRDTIRAIRTLWRRCSMGTYTVAACLRSRALMLRPFHYPAMAPAEVESALWLEAEEALQLTRDEIAMHWHVDQPGTGEAAGASGVMVAAPHKDVERQIALLEEAGLYPVVMDVGCMAVANLYLAVQGAAATRDPVCLVNLSGRSADVAVLYGSGAIYPRTFFSSSGPWTSAVDYLTANVSDVLKYFEFKLRRPAVRRLVLTGQVPDGNLQQRLADTAGVPVELWDPMAAIPQRPLRLGRVASASRASPLAMATALGLALRRA